MLVSKNGFNIKKILLWSSAYKYNNINEFTFPESVAASITEQHTLLLSGSTDTDGITITCNKDIEGKVICVNGRIRNTQHWLANVSFYYNNISLFSQSSAGGGSTVWSGFSCVSITDVIKQNKLNIKIKSGYASTGYEVEIYEIAIF